MRLRTVLALVAVAALGAGCATSQSPLANGRESSTTLARDVLTALRAGNASLARSLALTEEEFHAHIWPSLPAARPERNLPFAYVWGDLRQKSDAGLQTSLAQYRGQSLTLLDVRFGEPSTYGRATVHREAIFAVRDTAGTTSDIRVCGSFVEQAGRWKVFSYVLD
jgi:hypothetical protein